MSQSKKEPNAIREDLALMAGAALHPGHHLSYAALGIFAERILALVEDHRRLETELAASRAQAA